MRSVTNLHGVVERPTLYGMSSFAAEYHYRWSLFWALVSECPPREWDARHLGVGLAWARANGLIA